MVNNCDGTSTLTASATGTLLWSTGESTSSITVQTAATYTVTTNAEWMYKFTRFRRCALKQLLLLRVNVVNNCDGTLTASDIQELYYGHW
jgi:hypothetical protein